MEDDNNETHEIDLNASESDMANQIMEFIFSAMVNAGINANEENPRGGRKSKIEPQESQMSEQEGIQVYVNYPKKISRRANKKLYSDEGFVTYVSTL